MRQADVSDSLDAPEDSLILLSHVLTENQRRIGDLLTAAAVTSANGELLVVERHDDRVWGRISVAARGLDRSHEIEELEVEQNALMILPFAGGRTGRLRTGWMLLSRPKYPAVARIVARYFHAWRAKDPSLLADVFATDAQYFFDPLASPLSGLSAIAEYWTQKVVPQNQLKISLHAVDLEAESAKISWTARFVREGVETTVCGAMSLEVDSRIERVTALRERYQTQRRPVIPT